MSGCYTTDLGKMEAHSVRRHARDFCRVEVIYLICEWLDGISDPQAL